MGPIAGFGKVGRAVGPLALSPFARALATCTWHPVFRSFRSADGPPLRVRSCVRARMCALPGSLPEPRAPGPVRRVDWRWSARVSLLRPGLPRTRQLPPPRTGVSPWLGFSLSPRARGFLCSSTPSHGGLSALPPCKVTGAPRCARVHRRIPGPRGNRAGCVGMVGLWQSRGVRAAPRMPRRLVTRVPGGHAPARGWWPLAAPRAVAGRSRLQLPDWLAVWLPGCLAWLPGCLPALLPVGATLVRLCGPPPFWLKVVSAGHRIRLTASPALCGGACSRFPALPPALFTAGGGELGARFKRSPRSPWPPSCSLGRALRLGPVEGRPALLRPLVLSWRRSSGPGPKSLWSPFYPPPLRRGGGASLEGGDRLRLGRASGGGGCRRLVRRQFRGSGRVSCPRPPLRSPQS